MNSINNLQNQICLQNFGLLTPDFRLRTLTISTIFNLTTPTYD
jgi:hypothetical protein